MANTLGAYDPVWFANTALDLLYENLGMALAVHRGYDRTPQEKGSTIQIRRPGTFESKPMGGSNDGANKAQDVSTETLEIKLDQWEGVTYALRDDELTYARETIIQEHIEPAVMALAIKIDASLCGLWNRVPWVVDAAETGAVTDFTNCDRVLFDNKVPEAMRYLMVNGERKAAYQALPVFHQANTSSDGEMTQRTGFLGDKFGFNIFANQNVVKRTLTTGGTALTGFVGAASAAQTAGQSSLAVDGLGPAAGVVDAGTTFSIAGQSQRYVTTEATPLASGGGTLNFFPVLEANVANNAVVTLHNHSGRPSENLAFHRTAFALAMAPLSLIGDGMGAAIHATSDPRTNLSLRARTWYDADNSRFKVGVDALWGQRVLNENRAVRLLSK